MTRDQIELLAQAIHERYRQSMAELGAETTRSPLANLTWEQLSDVDQRANRAQAIDIEVKLFELGYELVPLDHPYAAAFDADDDLERLAEYEHERWLTERRAAGWTYGDRNDELRTHPFIVPYDDLSEDQKELDRRPVRHIPDLLRLVGLGVRRCDS